VAGKSEEKSSELRGERDLEERTARGWVGVRKGRDPPHPPAPGGSRWEERQVAVGIDPQKGGGVLWRVYCP
jgi:hypothetical protein